MKRKRTMKRGHSRVKSVAVLLIGLFLAAGFTTTATEKKAIELSDEQVEDIVRRSYQYVALYNVINKFAMDPEKLAASPLNDNVQYLRFMVDPRLAEGKRAEFNVSFTDEKVSYAIALRNGVIAITEQPNKGPTIELSKDNWSKLITGEKSFAGQHASLKAFDEAIGP